MSDASITGWSRYPALKRWAARCWLSSGSVARKPACRQVTAMLHSSRCWSRCREPAEVRRRLAAELIGDDYPRLQASLHLRAPVSAMRADSETGLLTVLDRQNELQLWRLGADEPHRWAVRN